MCPTIIIIYSGLASTRPVGLPIQFFPRPPTIFTRQCWSDVPYCWTLHWTDYEVLVYDELSKVTWWVLWYKNIIQQYCKTLIIRVTLFSRGYQPRFIHETLFSRFAMSSPIFLITEIIGEDFIFASLCSRELTRK